MNFWFKVILKNVFFIFYELAYLNNDLGDRQFSLMSFDDSPIFLIKFSK